MLVPVAVMKTLDFKAELHRLIGVITVDMYSLLCTVYMVSFNFPYCSAFPPSSLHFLLSCVLPLYFPLLHSSFPLSFSLSLSEYQRGHACFL